MRFANWFWIIVTFLAFWFNIFGLMRLTSLFITMPILFVSIYFTIYSFVYRRAFRGFR